MRRIYFQDRYLLFVALLTLGLVMASCDLGSPQPTFASNVSVVR